MDRALPRPFVYLASIALLYAVVRGWLMPLSSSFYLDETGSVYLVSGTWSQVLERMSITIQSPLYISFLWLWSRVAGFSEVALRLPSVLAALASGYLLYRLGTRLVDRQTGIAAAMVHLSIGLVIQQTFQARPYSFGVLTAIIAISSMVDWLARRTWSHVLRTVLALAALLYLQPLNASMLAVVAVLAGLYLRSKERLPIAQLAAILGMPVVLLLPVLPYYRGAAKEAAIYVYTIRPSLDQFANIYGDLISPGAILLGLLVAVLFVKGFEFSAFEVHPFAIRTCIVWVTLPALLVFAYSRVMWPAFVLRYYSVAFPAISLCLALLFRAVSPAPARVLALSVFSLTCATAVWSTAFWPRTSEWRAGSEVLRQRGYAPDTPVLVGCGFIESKSLQRLQEPVSQGFLLAPTYAYPVAGRLYAMPYNPSMAGGSYWKTVLSETVERQPRVMIYAADPEWHSWFQAEYGSTRNVVRLHAFVTEVTTRQASLPKPAARLEP